MKTGLTPAQAAGFGGEMVDSARVATLYEELAFTEDLVELLARGLIEVEDTDAAPRFWPTVAGCAEVADARERE